MAGGATTGRGLVEETQEEMQPGEGLTKSEGPEEEMLERAWVQQNSQARDSNHWDNPDKRWQEAKAGRHSEISMWLGKKALRLWGLPGRGT